MISFSTFSIYSTGTIVACSTQFQKEFFFFHKNNNNTQNKNNDLFRWQWKNLNTFIILDVVLFLFLFFYLFVVTLIFHIVTHVLRHEHADCCHFREWSNKNKNKLVWQYKCIYTLNEKNERKRKKNFVESFVYWNTVLKLRLHCIESLHFLSFVISIEFGSAFVWFPQYFLHICQRDGKREWKLDVLHWYFI